MPQNSNKTKKLMLFRLFSNQSQIIAYSRFIFYYLLNS